MVNDSMELKENRGRSHRQEFELALKVVIACTYFIKVYFSYVRKILEEYNRHIL